MWVEGRKWGLREGRVGLGGNGCWSEGCRRVGRKVEGWVEVWVGVCGERMCEMLCEMLCEREAAEK